MLQVTTSYQHFTLMPNNAKIPDSILIWASLLLTICSQPPATDWLIISVWQGWRPGKHPWVGMIPKGEAQTSLPPLCVVWMFTLCECVYVCVHVCLSALSHSPTVFPSQPAGCGFCWVRKTPLSHVIEILPPEVGGLCSESVFLGSLGVLPISLE